MNHRCGSEASVVELDTEVACGCCRKRVGANGSAMIALRSGHGKNCAEGVAVVACENFGDRNAAVRAKREYTRGEGLIEFVLKPRGRAVFRGIDGDGRVEAVIEQRNAIDGTVVCGDARLKRCHPHGILWR